MVSAVYLKKGREKSILRRHPWIFDSAIEAIEGKPGNGETVDIFSYNKQFLARGAYSHYSKIRTRIWTWLETEEINSDFFYSKINTAIQFRKSIPGISNTNAYRLIYAESDGIPGLIVDRYDDLLVMQCLSAGVENWREVILEILSSISGISAIYERSDVDVRELEGLENRTGKIYGEKNEGSVKIIENGLHFMVDVANGQKTGFYLDQRYGRESIRKYSNSKDVLDCFCYTGGFTISAIAGGAKHVFSIDTSVQALELGKSNLKLNEFDPNIVTWMNLDVFKALRSFRDSGRKFDLIILDPPKFAPTISQVERAARGYKDINLLAFKLLRPGGLLFTFSCSGGVSAELFQKIVSSAAIDAGVEATIIEFLSQGADHPVSLNFPESAYLKGLVVALK